MPTSNKKRLKNIKVNEVSIVDAGANNRKYAILKSQKGVNTDMEKATKKNLVTNKQKINEFINRLFKAAEYEQQEDSMVKRNKDDDEPTEKDGDEDTAEAAAAKADGQTDAKKDSADGDIVKELLNAIDDYTAKRKAATSKDDGVDTKTDESYPDSNAVKGMRKGDEDLDGVLNKVASALKSYLLDENKSDESSELLQNMSDDDLKGNVTMNKNLSKAASIQLQKAQSVIAKQNERIVVLEKEADDRKKVEFINKAEKFKTLGVEAGNFGLVLKSLSEKSPKEFGEIMKALNKASETIEKSGVMSELGNGNSWGSQQVGGRLAERVEAIQKSAGNKVTKEQAIAKALEENPELYDEYLETK